MSSSHSACQGRQVASAFQEGFQSFSVGTERIWCGVLCYTPALSPALLVDSCPRYRLWHSSSVGGTGTSLPALLLPLETVWLFFAESLRQQRVCGFRAVELGTSVFSPCSPAPSCVILNKLLHLSEPQCHLLHDVANNAVPERSL